MVPPGVLEYDELIRDVDIEEERTEPKEKTKEIKKQ